MLITCISLLLLAKIAYFFLIWQKKSAINFSKDYIFKLLLEFLKKKKVCVAVYS